MTLGRCPLSRSLLGVKRTWPDPKRTFSPVHTANLDRYCFSERSGGDDAATGFSRLYMWRGYVVAFGCVWPTNESCPNRRTLPGKRGRGFLQDKPSGRIA